MPDRYRGAVRTAVALAIVALGAAAVIIPVLIGLDHRDQERAYARDAAAEYAQIREYCTRDGILPGPQMTTCLIERARAQREEQYDYADLRAQQEVAVWTGGVFGLGLVGYFISILGIVFLYANLRMLQRQIADDRTAATEQTTQFNLQIEKMEDANRDARESAERRLRAYVGYDSIRMLELRNHSQHFQIIWKNTGQTPTRTLATRWGYWCEPDLPPDGFSFPDAHPEEGASAGGVGAAGAGQEFFSNGPIITSEQLNAVFRGELRVLYWAWVEYDDVFPNTPRRRSEACYRLVLIPSEGSIQYGWIAYGPFNGTDEECMKQPQPRE